MGIELVHIVSFEKRLRMSLKLVEMKLGNFGGVIGESKVSGESCH